MGNLSHVVALSGGKDSTAMALRLKELNRKTEYIFVITPTGAELPEMQSHWEKCERLLGQRLTVVNPGFTLMDLAKKQKMLPNFRARFCTRLLKIVPYQHWLSQHLPAVSYVGLRADEEQRTGMEFEGMSDQLQVSFPLREWGWGICEVLGYLLSRGVTIPDRTDCDRCYHQTIHEWWILWRKYPDRWASAVDDEDRTGHTYRSPGRDTWPASLRELADAFHERGEPTQRIRDTQCKACSL